MEPVTFSAILFGAGTTEVLKHLSEQMLLSVFEGVPQSLVTRDRINSGAMILEFLADMTGIFSSRGEARRMIKDNAVLLNKERIGEEKVVSAEDLLRDKYLLVQKGKKNYYLVIVE